MYIIEPYTRQQASRMGLTVKPSHDKYKKIDVFKNGEKIASVGDTRYKDYTKYLKEDKALAEERRKLYHERHQGNTLRERLARKLLW
jgi:hypothetical protein